MKKKLSTKLTLIFGITILICIQFAFWTSGAEATAKTTPLLDRELFSGDPQIACAQVSPLGTHIAFLKPYNGVLNIWIKKIDEPFSTARPITSAAARPLHTYSWSRDGKFLLYVSDQGGNENYHLFAIDPFDKSTPEAKDLTPYDNVRVEMLSMPKENPGIVFVGMNDRDERYHDVYQLCLSTGERTLIQQNGNQISDWVFDRAGKLRLGLRAATDGSTQILKVDTEGMPVLWTCSCNESVQTCGFHKDGKRVYISTNKGEEVDLARLMLLNTETGEEELVESDPENEVDFGAPIFSMATDELVATAYIGDRQRLYFKNQEWEKDFQTLEASLPDGEIDLVSSTNDESLWVICVRSDIDPETAYLYNRNTQKIYFLYKARPNLPFEYLSSMQPIVYTARDGLPIHGYLTIPKGEHPRNLPLVVFPHGGPWARDVWGYDRSVQLLSNRGYAVLQMNFRGSTGYGKRFLNAGNKQWGDAMQNDITDGVLHLISQGIADPKRIAIFGGSYGGYATLAGLAFTPDIYAAGISYVGPSNLITLLNSLPAYWETGRSYMEERVGDTKNPDDVARLERQSPLFSARNITAPLLVVQGANDPRVKKAESDQIVIALRTLGRDVEYIVAPDEGHGFARVENRLAFAVAMEKFLAKHLGGRFQEEIPATTEQRLEQITVDIKTVSLDGDQS
jgi:dipeptidyl aminopeptidase/acylaminoacyl peptidase